MNYEASEELCDHSDCKPVTLNTLMLFPKRHQVIAAYTCFRAAAEAMEPTERSAEGYLEKIEWIVASFRKHGFATIVDYEGKRVLIAAVNLPKKELEAELSKPAEPRAEETRQLTPEEIEEMKEFKAHMQRLNRDYLHGTSIS